MAFFSDNFDSGSGYLEDRANWGTSYGGDGSDGSSHFALTSNEIQLSGNPHVKLYCLSTSTPPTANYEVELNIKLSSETTVADIGPLLRGKVAPSGKPEGYNLGLYPGSNYVQIYRLNGDRDATDVGIGNQITITDVDWTTYHTIKFRIQTRTDDPFSGTRPYFRVYLDGVQQGSEQNDGIDSWGGQIFDANNPGVICNGISSGTVYFDDFVCTDLGDTSESPSSSPSISPSGSPSLSPSASISPSESASLSPSESPSLVSSESESPSISPSISFSVSPSSSPSLSPSASLSPSISPSLSVSESPSISPSSSPSISFSVSPSISFSESPSASPSISPSASISPSGSFSVSPSLSPSLSTENDFLGEESLQAHYRFESGALTTDSSGKGNTLTDVNTVAEDTVNFKEGACSADFERTSTQCFYRTDTNLSANFPFKVGDAILLGSFTGWFKPESIPAANMAFLSKYATGGNVRSWILYTVSGGELTFIWSYNTGASNETWSTGYTISAGTWYHIGFTMNAGTKTVTMRIWDGASATSLSNIFTNDLSVRASDFQVGSFSGANQFDGLIDELVVFNRILSDAEFDQIRQGTFTTVSSSMSPSVSPSASLSPSISISASPSISYSSSPSISISTSPSLSPSASLSPSESVSSSPSESLSQSPSQSPSISPSVSPSFSPSQSPSLSPSASLSPSISFSASPSISPSQSPSISPSFSPSVSPSQSFSVSPSVSVSASPSFSPSISESLSPSVSVSGSPSRSPSQSPSPSPSGPPPIEGSTCWGHSTGVLETNTRTFVDNWTGTGSIENSGDSERLALGSGEYMEGEVVNTSPKRVELLQNNYQAGDTVTLKYRHGATESDCLSSGWSVYGGIFVSLGYVQVRVESTL